MTALGWVLLVVCGVPLFSAFAYVVAWLIREAIRGDVGARAGLAFLGFMILCIGLSAGIVLVFGGGS